MTGLDVTFQYTAAAAEPRFLSSCIYLTIVRPSPLYVTVTAAPPLSISRHAVLKLQPSIATSLQGDGKLEALKTSLKIPV